MNEQHRELCLPVRPGISLTEPRAGDVENLILYLNDVGIYERMLLLPFPYTYADAKVFFSNARKAKKQYGHPVHLSIRLDDGQLIGGWGLKDLVPGHRAEIGYWLARPYWGQGLMTDVVAAGLAYARRQWELVRIFAYVFEGNEPSTRVLKKNGFEYEGMLRKYNRKDGQFINAWLFANVV